MRFKRVGEVTDETDETSQLPQTLEEEVITLLGRMMQGEFATKAFGEATDYGYEHTFKLLTEIYEKYGYAQPTTEDNTPNK